MRARTRTPRGTASASARSIALRSKRKMHTSIETRARRRIWTIGATPASGWTISCMLFGLDLRFLFPLHAPFAVRRQGHQPIRDAIGRQPVRRRDQIGHLFVGRAAQLERRAETAQDQLDL